jgi:hypothetical protein
MEMLIWVPFEEQDWQGVLQLLVDREQLRIPMTSSFCHAAISTYMRLKDPVGTERVLTAYLTTYSFTRHLERNHEWFDVQPFIALTAGEYIQSGRIADAKRLVLKWHAQDIVIDEGVIGRMLVTCSEYGSVGDMLDMLRFVDENGFTLDKSHHVIAIDYFGKQGRLDLALQWYERATQQGMQGDTFIVTCVIQAYSYAKKGVKALQIYRSARKKYGLRVNPTILSVLCDMAGYSHSVPVLEQLWDEGVADGVEPNENNLASFAEAYWRLGAFDKAAHVLLDMMPLAGFAPNYNILITVNRWVKERKLMTVYNATQQAIEKWYPDTQTSTTARRPKQDKNTMLRDYVQNIKKYK